ncbi:MULTISPECIES: dihydroxyacetone kinase transcriptional activator DhaS [Anaerotruncus]|uniref:dihydroxyacetone kinase transcriptional activator DhaS n=1 Tax=Anaerotruncus TaxID=244127 RepID=UPI000834C2D9|nr:MULTISPECIES: dihydroxyacetone kinase transcriptional activator DhaS [Anaerotruncus]RGX55935.1 dihydroxyacetone kinase transcriptional activator DhaS [Anaerotruncus sp. AF02-27]
MTDIPLTKRVLAESIKDLMQSTPLSKISVGDITAHCGVNRNTFYYHFKDKYDLVNWIYYTETFEQMSSFSDRAHWEEGLCNLCLYMQRNRKFYINALSVMGQNSFSEYLIDFYDNLLITCIHELTEGQQVDEQDVRFVARFYTYAFVGIIEEWAHRGMQEDPIPYVNRVKEIIDGSMVRELQERRGESGPLI